MIKAIIFDLGGVVAKNDFGAINSSIAHHLHIDEESFKQLLKKYHQEILCGRISLQDFDIIVAKEFNLNKIDSNIWKKEYTRLMPLNKELIKIIVKLKQNYKVGMISNIYNLSRDAERERETFGYFDPCVLSCEVGFAKPGKEIFNFTLKELNLIANQCIFIDDQDKNCVAANNLGFKTILYKNNKQLIEDLKKLGIGTF